MFDMERFARISAEVSGRVMREGQTKQKILGKSLISSYDETDLGEIKGVGEETQKILFENGIYNQEQLKEVGIEGLNKIGKMPYFGKKGIESFLGMGKNN